MAAVRVWSAEEKSYLYGADWVVRMSRHTVVHWCPRPWPYLPIPKMLAVADLWTSKQVIPLLVRFSEAEGR